MNSPAVQELCLGVWQARELGRLPDDVGISRALALATAADVVARNDYDPEMDRRVEWLREVARQRRMLRRDLRPEAASDLEDLIEWMLYGHREVRRCGKMAAAGEEVGD